MHVVMGRTSSFPTFAGAAPQHVLCHYRVITDVIIHNEVRSEKRVLLIVMTTIFIKMRNLESNNTQSVEIGVEMEQPENEWNQGGKVTQFPFPGPVAP